MQCPAMVTIHIIMVGKMKAFSANTSQVLVLMWDFSTAYWNLKSKFEL